MLEADEPAEPELDREPGPDRAEPRGQADSDDAKRRGESDPSSPGGLAWSYEFDLAEVLAAIGVSRDEDPSDEESLAAERALIEADDAAPRDLTGVIADHLPAGPGLAAWLANAQPDGLADWDLPGIAAAYRRVASWAQSAELAAVATIASRSAARDEKIGTDASGRPARVSAAVAAEVSLALTMTQNSASWWTDLAVAMRWRLPATGDALAAGSIDLNRARLIHEATARIPEETAQTVESMVLPRAGEQTTAQLRAALRRAVIVADPEGAEERRKEAELRAKVSLYPDDDGTASMTGSKLPSVHAAAAMARISAMARAMKASGAGGGLDLLRAQVFVGLLLGTLPLIPPSPDGPPDDPRAPSDPGDDADLGGQDDADPGGQDDGCEPGGPDGDTDSGDPADVCPAPGRRADHWSDPAGQAEETGSCCPPPRDRPPDGPRNDRYPPPDLPGGGLGSRNEPPSRAHPPPDDDGLCRDDRPRDPAGRDPCDDEDAAQGIAPLWPPLPATIAEVPPVLGRRSSRFDSGTGPPKSGTGPPPKETGPCTEPRRPPPGLLDLTIPWSALAGLSAAPASLGRIGPVTAPQALPLALTAVPDPNAQWRVILTDPAGQALAVERLRRGRLCLQRGQRGQRGQGVVGRVTVTVPASVLDRPPPSTGTPAGGILTAVLRAARRAATSSEQKRAADASAPGGCAHSESSSSYRPPPRIREFVEARDQTCRQSFCGQPAWRADLDHTQPWANGGLTCSCNLGGFCRTHHQVKQEPGWTVTQPRPGHFQITTPAGRTYDIHPDTYPA